MPLRLAHEAADGAATERVFVLDDAQARYTSSMSNSRSRCRRCWRGFSAPVILNDGLSDTDLLVLLQHDTDPFKTVGKAAQRLALSRLVAATRAAEPASLDAPFIEAMRAVLRHPGPRSGLQDLVLTLPGEAYIASRRCRSIRRASTRCGWR